MAFVIPEFDRKNISLKDYHVKYIKENSINLSRFIQTKLDDLIYKREKIRKRNTDFFNGIIYKVVKNDFEKWGFISPSEERLPVKR